MLLPPVSLALGVCAILFGLAALTMFVLRRGLCSNIATASGLNWIRFFEVGRWFFQTLFILVLVGAIVPLQLVLFFAGIMLFFQIQISLTSAKRERESLGVLMVQVHCGRGSIPDLLEAYGRGNLTLSGAKARLTADAIRRGVSLLNACDLTKLRLPTTSRMVLSSPPSNYSLRAIQNTVSTNDPTLISKLAMITAYVPILLIFMMATYSFLAMFIFPTFKEIFEEFDMSGPGVEMLDLLSDWIIPPMVGIILVGVIYTGFIFLFWLLGFERALSGLPIFGRIIVQSRRATLLDALAFSTSQHKSLPDAFQELGQATNFRSERQALKRCLADVENGGSSAQALSSLLNKTQIAWIQAADQNRHLSETLSSLAESIRRRLRRRIECSVSVLLPVIILLCAVPVGLVCYAVMRTLTDLITELV